MPDATAIAVVDAVEEVLGNTLSLFRSNDGIDPRTPTSCPGWDVQDQLSHMVGLEQDLAGAEGPEVVLPDLPHVSTELDEYMERHVQARRQLPLDAVVDELAGFLPRCIARYRELLGQGDPEVAAPMGRTRPLSVALGRRAFDLWVHELDIRTALGFTARETTGFNDAGSLASALILDGWSKRIPEASAADGVLRISVAGVPQRDRELVLGDGGPVAMLGLDLTELYILGCGRNENGAIPSTSTIAGSRELVHSVLPAMSLTS